jgi:hypothetical protein
MWFPIITNRSPEKHPKLFGNREFMYEVSENEKTENIACYRRLVEIRIKSDISSFIQIDLEKAADDSFQYFYFNFTVHFDCVKRELRDKREKIIALQYL